MLTLNEYPFLDRGGRRQDVGDVSASVYARIPVYSFSLAGYGHGNRHELGGLTEATFAPIPNIEAGLAARWPWAEAAEVQ